MRSINIVAETSSPTICIEGKSLAWTLDSYKLVYQAKPSLTLWHFHWLKRWEWLCVHAHWDCGTVHKVMVRDDLAWYRLYIPQHVQLPTSQLCWGREMPCINQPAWLAKCSTSFPHSFYRPTLAWARVTLKVGTRKWFYFGKLLTYCYFTHQLWWESQCQSMLKSIYALQLGYARILAHWGSGIVITVLGCLFQDLLSKFA